MWREKFGIERRKQSLQNLSSKDELGVGGGKGGGEEIVCREM